MQTDASWPEPEFSGLTVVRWYLAHYFPLIFTFCIVVAGVRLLFEFAPNYEFASLLFETGVGALSAACYFLHSISPCGLCAQQFPENPEQEAEKRRTTMWWGHYRHYIMLVWIAVLLANLSVRQLMPSALITTAFALAAVLPFGLFLLAAHVHNRLKLWCPWCRDEGGGHDDHRPTPTPVDHRAA